MDSVPPSSSAATSGVDPKENMSVLRRLKKSLQRNYGSHHQHKSELKNAPVVNVHIDAARKNCPDEQTATSTRTSSSAASSASMNRINPFQTLRLFERTLEGIEEGPDGGANELFNVSRYTYTYNAGQHHMDKDSNSRSSSTNNQAMKERGGSGDRLCSPLSLPFSLRERRSEYQRPSRRELLAARDSGIDNTGSFHWPTEELLTHLLLKSLFYSISDEPEDDDAAGESAYEARAGTTSVGAAAVEEKKEEGEKAEGEDGEHAAHHTQQQQQPLLYRLFPDMFAALAMMRRSDDNSHNSDSATTYYNSHKQHKNNVVVELGAGLGLPSFFLAAFQLKRIYGDIMMIPQQKRTQEQETAEPPLTRRDDDNTPKTDDDAIGEVNLHRHDRTKTRSNVLSRFLITDGNPTVVQTLQRNVASFTRSSCGGFASSNHIDRTDQDHQQRQRERGGGVDSSVSPPCGLNVHMTAQQLMWNEPAFKLRSSSSSSADTTKPPEGTSDVDVANNEFECWTGPLFTHNAAADDVHDDVLSSSCGCNNGSDDADSGKRIGDDSTATGGYRLVLASDCLFFDKYHTDLRNVLRAALDLPGPRAHNNLSTNENEMVRDHKNKNVIIMMAPRRGTSMERFVALMEEEIEEEEGEKKGQGRQGGVGGAAIVRIFEDYDPEITRIRRKLLRFKQQHQHQGNEKGVGDRDADCDDAGDAADDGKEKEENDALRSIAPLYDDDRHFPLLITITRRDLSN